jgi:HSP20 family protein
MSFVPWKSKQRQGEPTPRSVAGLRAEFDRLLENYVREPLSSLEWPFGIQRGCIPPVDLAENPEEVLVRAEIPGVDPNNLEVTVSGGQIVLAGEKPDVVEAGGRDFYHTENRFGRFRRAIPLPQAVDPEHVEAEYVHGVLTVRLKKTASAPPKRVEIKVWERESVMSPGSLPEV